MIVHQQFVEDWPPGRSLFQLHPPYVEEVVGPVPFLRLLLPWHRAPWCGRQPYVGDRARQLRRCGTVDSDGT